MHQQQNRGAFTLIELLVVISIISLLISILLPSLQKAREAGQMARNLSNLRQIQIGLHTYAGDNNSSLLYQRFDATGGNTPYWAGKLAGEDYISDPFIFWGPFRNPDWFGTGPWTSRAAMIANPASANSYERSGYGVNGFIMPAEASGDAPLNMDHQHKTHTDALNENPGPADIATMAEFFFNTTDGTKFGWWTGPGNNQWMFTVNGSAARAYLDGHAVAGDASEINWLATDNVTGSWRAPSIVYFRREPWFRPN